MDVGYDDTINSKHHESKFNDDPILLRLNILIAQTLANEDALRSGHIRQEEIVCQMPQGNALASHIQALDAKIKAGELVDPSLYQKRQEAMKIYSEDFRVALLGLKQQRKRVFDDQFRILRELTFIKEEVIFVNLKGWICEQQKNNLNTYSSTNAASNHTNGSPSALSVGDQGLDRIEKQVQGILDVALLLKKQTFALASSTSSTGHRMFAVEGLTNFRYNIDRFIEDVILNSFVVEKQPPQVMKTNTRFSATCRFLCGTKLNTNATGPSQVQVMILSETNARNAIKGHKDLIKTSWNLLEEKGMNFDVTNPIKRSSQVMEYQQNGQVMKGSMEQQRVSFGDCEATTSPLSPVLGFSEVSSGSPDQPILQQQYSESVIRSNNFINQHDDNNDDSLHSNRRLKVLDLNQFKSSGEMLNHTNPLEVQESSGHVTCNFRNMQLKKILRAEKKGTESVMDEKFVLFFATELRILSSAPDQRDDHFQIMAFSLPVVVIVHGNQEPHAWATVTWHNAFAKPDDLLYQVPERVKWKDLGHVLSEKFRDCTGKGLSPQNLEHLGCKITKSQQIGPDLLVTWSQFAKEPTCEKNLTFWEWFHAILKLTKEHLRDLWVAGLIYGFNNKSGCLSLLSEESMEIGTFLLRFSESELGGISIAFLSGLAPNQRPNQSPERRNQSPTYGVAPSGNIVYHLLPYSSKDLNTRPLADRIRDLAELSSLYPNIPKDEAFRRYYSITESDSTQAGYIKPYLVQTLPESISQSNNRSSPVPQSNPHFQHQRSDSSVAPTTPNSLNMNSPNDTNFITDMDISHANMFDQATYN